MIKDRFDNAPFLFDGVFSGESVSSAVHGIVEQSFVGFLPVSEGGSEVDVEIDRSGDSLHTRGFRLQKTW